MTLEHGNLYVQGGATAQTELATGTLWSKLTAFTIVGPENSVKANAGNDEMEVLHDAIYFAFAQVDFVGTVNTRFEFALLKNDKATPIQAGRSITATGTYDNVAFGSTLSVRAGDRLALGVQAPATGTSITIDNAQLTAFRINNEW